ncbi:MAG: hypothetical protein GEU99_06100 [Luteitalea sp.]|nr:hypothetical protein [Luteitalea sp.]
MSPRIAVFPKCYFDELCDGRRDYLQWIQDALTLGGEGLEHYDGFFRSFAPEDVDPIVRLIETTGQVSAMLCFSPDFTHPDPDARAREVARQKAWSSSRPRRRRVRERPRHPRSSSTGVSRPASCRMSRR